MRREPPSPGRYGLFPPLPAHFGTWGMLVFGILLAVVSFRIEAQKAKENLESLLQ